MGSLARAGLRRRRFQRASDEAVRPYGFLGGRLGAWFVQLAARGRTQLGRSSNHRVWASPPLLPRTI